jgi:hypothetical protein
MPRKRTPKSFTSQARRACGEEVTSFNGPKVSEDFSTKVLGALRDQRVIVSSKELERLSECLVRSIRQRLAVGKRWAKNRSTDDIIGLINIARESRDLDETIWRSFLAAHFGRSLADESQISSASRFLCAFGAEPYWTLQRVSENPSDLRKWLLDHKVDLQTLAYGNHRKYESKKPAGIWKVIKSFLDLANERDGPAGLIAVDPTPDDGDNFELLYSRLKRLIRFGRTGRFDFLALLIDLQLVAAEPASCYLGGSTGPLKGAKKLWGKRPIRELDDMAAALAVRLGISPMVLEDALCNSQKHES